MSNALAVQETDDILSLENGSAATPESNISDALITKDATAAPAFRVGASVRRDIEIEVEKKDVKATIKLDFRAFRNESLKEYDNAGATITETTTDGEEETERSRRAYVVFDECAVSGELVVNDVSIPKTLAQIKALRVREQLKAVASYLSFNIEVVEDETEGFDFLFETDGQIRCKVTIGKVENPQAVFYVNLSTPERDLIENWRGSYYKNKNLRPGQLPKYESKTNTQFLVNKFNSHFSYAENVILVDGENEREFLAPGDKDYFLKNFCALLKAAIMVSVLFHLEGK